MADREEKVPKICQMTTNIDSKNSKQLEMALSMALMDDILWILSLRNN